MVCWYILIVLLGNLFSCRGIKEPLPSDLPHLSFFLLKNILDPSDPPRFFSLCANIIDALKTTHLFFDAVHKAAGSYSHTQLLNPRSDLNISHISIMLGSCHTAKREHSITCSRI